ncbi:membrane-associated protein Hem-like isoform X2 [Convolutriloba macropyga]|uniref:membrane-associated protein Hem-like isoform X2 n=1 Tax=Convolutriloba macropyga TaxID=536237 RepID=UPI003F522C60
MSQNTYYHQKLAERLILLTSHGKGLLARVYHLRKMLSSSRSRFEKKSGGESTQLSFLFDSAFDSATKSLVRKFPFPQSVDTKTKDCQIIRDNNRKILSELQPFQQTFTDVHTFVMDACNALETVRTWLVVNFALFDVACYFLDLLATVFSLLMLLCKIDERKAIMALHGYLYRCDGASACDVRVETFINDLDPIAKLQSTLVSLESVLHHGLLSPLCTLFSRKMRDPKKYMDEFNLIMRPNQIADPFSDIVLEDTIFYSPEASYLSMETIEKWIIIMVIVCPRLLEDESIREQWRTLMSNRYAFPLFRDVIEKLHDLMGHAISGVSNFSSKDFKKQLERDIRHSQDIAVTKAPTNHKRARLFLRKSLKSNYLILSDVPGLLGLKTQLALVIMGAARDEVHWLVAHCTTEPPGKSKAPPSPDLKEPHLAEILYYLEKLRMLFKKYYQVIFVYHGSMIKRRNDDLAVAMQQAPPLPEHETTIFSDIINRIKSLPPPTDQSAATTEWEDFQGIRLDWIRLQTYLGDIPQDKRTGFLGLMSQGGTMGMAPSAYGRMQDVACRVTKAMFGITFSSKMVDYLDNVLNQVSDMSIFFSHLDMFTAHIQALLWTPAPPELSEHLTSKQSAQVQAAQLTNQINTNHLTSHVIAFPMLCAHFTNLIAPVAEYVPIEKMTRAWQEVTKLREHVSELSLTTCNSLLEEICKKACLCIREVCKQHQALSEQLLPKHAPHYGMSAVTPSVTSAPGGGTIKRKNVAGAPPVAALQDKPMPGSESARERRDKQITDLDKLTNEMVEVVTAINECDQIIVNRFSFAPREYLLSRLEATFMDQIREMVTEPEKRVKPSDMLAKLKATMSVMQGLESYVSLDMTRLFNTVLMQHSLPLDADGQITITQYYTKQYIQGFMSSISQSQAVYSDHFKCFISLPVPAPAPTNRNQPVEVPFPVEEFSDITELRCLAEMIGPYGVRYINEVISQKILAQYQELKKTATDYASKLNQIYQLIEAKPGDAVKLGDNLIGKDVRMHVNQLLTMMGAFLALRDLLSTALNDVLKRRVPFLMSCVSGLEKPDQRPDANDLAATAGFKVKYYDPILQQLLKIKNFEALRTSTKQENDQLVNCFITLFGLSLPDIVDLHNLPYNRHYETSGSNALCIGKAVNSIITMTLLMLPQPEEEYIRNCFVRFLTHASSCVLRMSEGGHTTSPADGSGDAGGMTPATLLMSRRSRDTTYLVLKQIVEDCPYLSMDALEAVFPYTLVRCAFHNSHLKEPPPRPVRQS